MKTMLMTLAAAAALAGAPALAAPPAGAAVKPKDMAAMTAEELHRHCSAMMGARMQGKPRHDHAADKLGHAPRTTPPTEAEMKAMHERCAARMGEHKTAAPPAKP